MRELRDRFFEELVSGHELAKEKARRKKPVIHQTVSLGQLAEYEQDGWQQVKQHKNKVRVARPKPTDMRFEDRVWVILADMDFKYLNAGRSFRLPYSDDCSLTQQVDVVAIDDETILIVECKATDSPNKNRSFKEVIEAIGGKKEGITTTLRKIFPDAKYKIKFILATSNYVLPKPDLDRLGNFDIASFEEDEVEYYDKLTKHLGRAAKYQLLGNLFQGKKIPELSNKVPAIRGSLGPHTFYSFSIEPERLLKIGYVLHRTKANKELMPTYQRIIKKERLRAVERFISGGGFFPNSVVISIDTKSVGKPLHFDLANTQCEDTSCRIGVLHLPQQYRCAYIIDGQHRVYGYANSKYRETSTVPVVAFENLPRSKQVDLFMQINENQKAVQKNLRNTLNAELLWDSSDRTEAMRALKLRIAQELGERKQSPLYGRVIVGEATRTPTTCIHLDTIYTALNRSNFFGTVTKNTIKECGTFYDGDVESTCARLLEFLMLSLGYVRENLVGDWELGERDDGFLAINPTMYCLIVILSDVVDHLVKKENVNPRAQAIQSLVEDVKPYLDPVIVYFRELPAENRAALRRSYGIGGRTAYWRTLQRVIQESRKDFNPDGLEQWIKDSSRIYNTRSFEIVRDIELHMRNDLKEALQTEYGKHSWWKRGVPLPVYEEAEKLASKKNREIADPEKEVDGWSCLHLIDLRAIILQTPNWSKLFQDKYSYPGVKGNKEEKTAWLVELNRLRNENDHVYSVTEEEYRFLEGLHAWLLGPK